MIVSKASGQGYLVCEEWDLPLPPQGSELTRSLPVRVAVPVVIAGLYTAIKVSSSPM